MKIILVAGARTDFMKIASILEAMKRFNQTRERMIEPILVHTGKHEDYAMSQSFFDDLNLPKPIIDLEVCSGSIAEQTGKIMTSFEQVLQTFKPDLVLVVGNDNSILASTVTAKKLKIPIAHLEAGLRSEEMEMSEQVNLKLTDFVSDYLFTTDHNANRNLMREGISGEKIFFIGNVMVESLLNYLGRAALSQILNHLDLREGLEIKPFGVVTLHRPSNIDNFQTFQEICQALSQISLTIPLIFPCHPRTQERIKSYGMEHFFGKSILHLDRIIITSPLSYLDFLHLNAHAKIILTDIGGTQEEAAILGVPCLTLWENTERPIKMTQGTNRLVGTQKENILNGFNLAMENQNNSIQKPEKWDGQASDRIVEILAGIDEERALRFKEEQPFAVQNWL